MNEEMKYDMIEDYLNGRMNEESLVSFENELKNDPLLRREVELHRELARSLKGEKFDKLRTTLKEVDAKWSSESSQQNRGKVIRMFPIVRTIAAAVSLLAVVSLWFWFANSSTEPQDLFAQTFEPYEMVLSQRSMEAAQYNGLETAIAAYADEDYYTANTLFQGLFKLNPQQPIFNLYACVSRLAYDSTGATISCFQELQTIKRLSEQATWYLALAHLKNLDIEKARATLLSIEKGQFMYLKAQSLLKELD